MDHSLQRPAAVLVDPSRSGRHFKPAARARDMAVLGIYTVGQGPADMAGDDWSLRGGDPESLARSVTGMARPAAVIACAEPAVVVADQLAARLGLPGNAPATAWARRDKLRMRDLGLARGVPAPAYRRADSPEDCRRAAAELGYPCIIKPARGAAAHGVRLLRGPRDLDGGACWPAADVFGSPVRQQIVEAYVRGDEYAVNTFSACGRHHVLDMWRKYQPTSSDYDQPYWNACQVPPADPAFAELAGFARQVLDAYDVTTGPAHIEVKRTPSGPCLIEIGARLPGAGIPELWQRQRGFDAFGVTLDARLAQAAEGTGPDLQAASQAVSPGGSVLGLCFIGTDYDGTLTGVQGLQDVLAWPGVTGCTPVPPPGTRLRATADLESVVLTVQVTAAGQQDFLRTCARIRRAVRVCATPAVLAGPALAARA